MENKNPKFDLEPNRRVYFQLGLFIVGAVTLMAFTYKTPVYLKEKKSVEQLVNVPIMFVEKEDKPIVEIPKVEKLPSTTPSTPILPQDFLSNIEPIKGSEVNPQIVISGGDPLPVAFGLDIGAAPDLTAVVKYPDIEAKFGGNWLEYLKGNMKYPQESILFEESGTAYVSFVVEIDGSITDVKVMNKGLSKSLEKEAIRVVKASPKWAPGSKNGEKVRSPQVVKVNFVLI